MLKEQVAEIILKGHMAEDEGGTSYPDKEADQILNLFKAEVDKLTVIDITGLTVGEVGCVNAQLQDIKKQLLDLMGE